MFFLFRKQVIIISAAYNLYNIADFLLKIICPSFDPFFQGELGKVVAENPNVSVHIAFPKNFNFLNLF